MTHICTIAMRFPEVPVRHGGPNGGSVYSRDYMSDLDTNYFLKYSFFQNAPAKTKFVRMTNTSFAPISGQVYAKMGKCTSLVLKSCERSNSLSLE